MLFVCAALVALAALAGTRSGRELAEAALHAAVNVVWRLWRKSSWILGVKLNLVPPHCCQFYMDGELCEFRPLRSSENSRAIAWFWAGRQEEQSSEALRAMLEQLGVGPAIGSLKRGNQQLEEVSLLLRACTDGRWATPGDVIGNGPEKTSEEALDRLRRRLLSVEALAESRRCK